MVGFSYAGVLANVEDTTPDIPVMGYEGWNFGEMNNVKEGSTVKGMYMPGDMSREYMLEEMFRLFEITVIMTEWNTGQDRDGACMMRGLHKGYM